MDINSVNAMSVGRVQELASVSILKKSMDSDQQAVMKLLESLKTFQDPALGQHIDTTA